jgi:hypothetical protein
MKLTSSQDSMKNKKQEGIGIDGLNAELLKYDKDYFNNVLNATNVCCDALKKSWYQVHVTSIQQH